MDQQNFGDYTVEQIREMGSRGKINPQTLKPYAQGKSNGITVEEAMSTEIDELEKRVASMEKEFRAVFGKAETVEPAPGSDAEHPPVGYVLVPHASGDRTRYDWLVWLNGVGPWTPFQKYIGETHTAHFFPCARPIPANEGDSRLTESVAIPVGWRERSPGSIECVTDRSFHGKRIAPDSSIPWGEGYEAILPSEADIICDEYKPHPGCKSWEKWVSIKGQARDEFAWRRRIPATTPTEPAQDLSDKIAESVVQDLQQACHDRDELRATVERLEAELDTTKRLLAESLVERDRLKNLHDARKVRIEGFRDVLRERLGDLV